MGTINLTRVLLGGLVAGVVVIVVTIVSSVFIGEQWAAAMENLGVEMPTSLGPSIVFLIISLLHGIALVWFYAAFRARFGPGIKTALIAGLSVWFVAGALIGANYVTVGLFPTSTMIASTLGTLVTILLASIAGAWIYKEN